MDVWPALFLCSGTPASRTAYAAFLVRWIYFWPTVNTRTVFLAEHRVLANTIVTAETWAINSSTIHNTKAHKCSVSLVGLLHAVYCCTLHMVPPKIEGDRAALDVQRRARYPLMIHVCCSIHALVIISTSSTGYSPFPQGASTRQFFKLARLLLSRTHPGLRFVLPSFAKNNSVLR